MNIEQRLRDAFAQRAGEVEVTPGALFEIQRRTSRTRRLPQVRLRPAFVLAAAACAAIATVVSVTLTQTAPDPGGEIAATPPVAATPDPAAVAPLPNREPATTDPPPPEGETPPAPPAGIEPSEQGSGQLTTVSPPTPPAPDPPPADTPPAPPPPQAGEKSDDTEPDEATTTTTAPETTACPVEPTGDGDTLTAFVTVYFACGDTDSAPRKRAVATNDLATALGTLLGGPNEADTTAGFRGLSADSTRTATATSDSRWVTIDLPADLGDAFDTETGVTAQQFLTQLNATVFQFSDVGVAEYRLGGNCAAFGGLLDQPCQVHTRDGDGYAAHTSELTAYTIGSALPIIRAEPYDSAVQVGTLTDGTRLTSRRTTDATSTWAEALTSAGQRGWVSTDTLVAQPLTLTGGTLNTIADLAKQLTSGPNIKSSAFMPGGLVVRWGANSDDVMVVSTAGAGIQSEWWHRVYEIPSPRDADTTASPADLFWIDGSDDNAVVTINTPGPLGEPHSDFANLGYVSIYQAAVARSTLPPNATTTTTTTTTAATSTDDGVDLPPSLPTDDESGDSSSSQSEETSKPLRAQISVIFDFLSPDGPRIAAVEAIWFEP